jgi:hypothetical protein
MNADDRPPDFLDLGPFIENQRNFPAEELLKYAGKHVAFSLDGTQILVSGQSFEDVERQLAAAGIDPSRVVHSYIPPPDLVVF